MKLKKLESGRSMVEMLGVLAIIGVLSVGGIAGYSLSMRRHRANGVVDLASKYALIVYNQCQQGLLNGEIDSISGCTSAQFNSFKDAGIGNLPSGIKIGCNYVESNSEGFDSVSLSAYFDDDKLCQAAGAIAGTGCIDGFVRFNIKQN